MESKVRSLRQIFISGTISYGNTDGDHSYVSPAQAPITRMPGRLSLSLEKRRVTRQEAQRRAGAARASLSTFAHDEFPFVEGGPFHGTQNGKEDHTDGEEHLDEKQSPTAQEQSPAFVHEDPADVPVSSQRRRVVSSEAASHMEATGEDTFVGSKKRKLEEVVEETGRELDAPPVKVRRSARVRRIPTRYDP